MKKIKHSLHKLKNIHFEISQKAINEDKRMLTIVFYELWRVSKRPILSIFIAFMVLLIVTPVATYLYFVRDISSKDKIINRKDSGIILLDRQGEPFFTFYDGRTKETITYDAIPDSMKQAVIAVEDKNFYTHPGVSISSVVRAALTNLQSQEILIGGSTITQQLVKNTLLSPDRNFLRKYQELILALELDRKYSKNDILDMYLNTVYFGEDAFGVESASRAYFGKSATDLTIAESALLAAVLPAPSALSPISGNNQRAFERQAVVLSEMEKQGYITNEEKNQALSEEIRFNPQRDELNIIAPHFALMVKEQLIEMYGEQKVARSGFTVTTTLDRDLQEYSENTVAAQVQRLTPNNTSNGAAVVLEPTTGEIMTLVGSHDWFSEENGKINMALAPRQPGSSFKPLVYAAALNDKVITPATELEDQEITFEGDYTPRNYDNRFRGDVLVRYALANSLNIPAVHVIEKIGVIRALEFAEQMGITTLSDPSNYGLSLVLGSAEIPLIEMTSAFGAFATEGELAKRTTILTILDKNGKEVYRHAPERKRVLGRGVSFQISSILSDASARATTFGNALTISRPAAVKTGTTEEYRDALTIGYTPQIVVGVWVGNNDTTPMDAVAGSLGAAPIWRQIIEQSLKDKPIVRFVKPSNIDQESVCRENGLRAVGATSSAYTEYFLPGTVPRGVCRTVEPTPSPQEENSEDNENGGNNNPNNQNNNNGNGNGNQQENEDQSP